MVGYGGMGLSDTRVSREPRAAPSYLWCLHAVWILAIKIERRGCGVVGWKSGVGVDGGVDHVRSHRR